MATILDIDHETGDLTEYDSTVTDSGDLSVTAAAALAGSYGLSALIDGTGAIYGQADFMQLSSTGWRLRFYLDVNGLTMASANSFLILELRASTLARLYFRLRYDGSNYEVRSEVYDDSDANLPTSYYDISDEPHYIEVDVTRATGASANDGTMRLWIDGSLQETVSGIDLYNLSQPDNCRFGATAQIDSGTSGTFYLDELILNDDHNLIGPVNSITTTMYHYRQMRAA